MYKPLIASGTVKHAQKFSASGLQKQYLTVSQQTMSSHISTSNFLRYVHPALEIPPAIQKVLLPNPTLSVAQFLQFPLPPISPFSEGHLPAAFFSCHGPTVDDSCLISKIPVPTAERVEELHEAWKSAASMGWTSVVCPHTAMASGMCVPLWIITYWTEVINLCIMREPWVRAETALRKRKKSHKNSGALIDQTYLALSTLQWSGDIQGFDNAEPMNHLARYATHQWLTDVHENQMLNMLRQELLLDPTKQDIEVQSLTFMTWIESGYNRRDKYDGSQYFSQACCLGEELSAGIWKSVLLLKNLNNEHWVALVLDFKNSCIRYGDSFDEDAPPKLMCAVEWWTYYHTGRHFTHAKLAITMQTDGFSCGLLAYNALAQMLIQRSTCWSMPQQWMMRGWRCC